MISSEVVAAYARVLKDRVTFRRYTGAGESRPFVEARDVRSHVAGYQPHELIGSIIQGDRKVIALVADLVDRKFVLPLTVNDKVIVDGKELAIIAPDGNTRSVNGELVAYEIQARG